MRLDPTIGWGHILTILTLIVTVALAAIFWHTRLVLVEATVLNIQDKIELYEKNRVVRDEQLLLRLNRIDDKLDLKKDK